MCWWQKYYVVVVVIAAFLCLHATHTHPHSSFPFFLTLRVCLTYHRKNIWPSKANNSHTLTLYLPKFRTLHVSTASRPAGYVTFMIVPSNSGSNSMPCIDKSVMREITKNLKTSKPHKHVKENEFPFVACQSIYSKDVKGWRLIERMDVSNVHINKVTIMKWKNEEEGT